MINVIGNDILLFYRQIFPYMIAEQNTPVTLSTRTDKPLSKLSNSIKEYIISDKRYLKMFANGTPERGMQQLSLASDWDKPFSIDNNSVDNDF